MNRKQIAEAIAEAHHFLYTAEEALRRLEEEKQSYFDIGTAESGACRRASLDLTRALARLRRRGI